MYDIIIQYEEIGILSMPISSIYMSRAPARLAGLAARKLSIEPRRSMSRQVGYAGGGTVRLAG